MNVRTLTITPEIQNDINIFLKVFRSQKKIHLPVHPLQHVCISISQVSVEKKIVCVFMQNLNAYLQGMKTNIFLEMRQIENVGDMFLQLEDNQNGNTLTIVHLFRCAS